ncbi:rab-protein geranylgeranyltransferase [Lentinula raphanica]|uniref:Geranylgeranyl transferase type-2 subunit alpha n=1 Tax=Lentinula raphanica TaxID=153919 RepID=A0AA38UIR9_9AGAR|nr:rab-protein geranylgeranyltransferase [Lentinula raphanica]
MHGVKRARQTPEALEARRLKEKSKLRDYLALTDNVLARKKRNDWSSEALHATTQLLQVNPEFYTIWNYRRHILVKGMFPDSTPEKIKNLLDDDLALTMAALKIHPKVYWIWTHREWCLKNVPNGPGTEDDGDARGWEKELWNQELFVVEKLLDADPRNFHAWSYRRLVLASMPIPKPELSELAYTTKKIESNFSNFSAWHQRSKVLTSLWSKGQLDETQSKEEEFELVHNAMYTDPNDQSVWIYHRWLVGTGDSGDSRDVLEREIAVIHGLLEEETDSKWCMESLVHYKRLLLRKHASFVDKSLLTQECIHLLEQLRKVDPGRGARYDEIELDLAQM